MKELMLRVLPAAANKDPEFAHAARMWNADIVFASDDDCVRVTVHDGRMTDACAAAKDAPAQIRISGPSEGWTRMLRALPPPFYQDLFGAAVHHGFVIAGSIEDVYPYYPALRRLIDLLRKSNGAEGG